VAAAGRQIAAVVGCELWCSPIRQGRLGMRSADRHRQHVSVVAAGGLVKWMRCCYCALFPVLLFLVPSVIGTGDTLVW
jgi:hypothetical protein